MKSAVISFLMLSMSLIFVSCENEGQLTQTSSDVEKQILDKKILYQEISFTGNLTGVPNPQNVYGCCPNRGPFPAYTMQLSGPFPSGISRIPLVGNVYINGFHHRMPWNYKVQFWWGGENGYFLEIRGGETERDRKAGWLKVTFTDEWMTIIDPNNDSTYVKVTFALIKQNIYAN